MYSYFKKRVDWMYSYCTYVVKEDVWTNKIQKIAPGIFLMHLGKRASADVTVDCLGKRKTFEVENQVRYMNNFTPFVLFLKNLIIILCGPGRDWHRERMRHHV